MLVCSKCGLPATGSGICPNCGSTSFKTIGKNTQVRQTSQAEYNPDPYSTQVLNKKSNRVPVSNGAYPINNKSPQVLVSKGPNTGAVAAAAAAGAAAGSKRTGVIIVSIVLAFIAVVSAIIIPIAVSNSNGPEKTIANLETAMNNMDINGMVDCFDSTLRNAYSAGSELMGGVLGFGYDTAADLLPFLSELTGEDMDMPQFEIEVLSKEEISSESCILTIRITTYYDGEATDVEEGPVEMVKEDGEWYIASDDLIDDLSSSFF